MAVVRPFKGLRPKDQKVAEGMISLPYDVMNRKEAKEMAEGNPYSFLHIVRSEINLDDSVDAYSKEVYENVKFMREHNFEIPDIVMFTSIAKQEKNVKIDFHRDIRDLIKDIYKHV